MNAVRASGFPRQGRETYLTPPDEFLGFYSTLARPKTL